MKIVDGYFVYKYVSAGGDIVYIGKSENIVMRIKQHGTFSGSEEKFGKYKDAKVYVHRCASKHEMDALEIILIEKYKPELNVSSKTENNLSFDFGSDVSWVEYETIIPKQSKEKTGKQLSEKPKGIISSTTGAAEFVEAVKNWHTLFYFISWLMEQKDTDQRTTITFGINNATETSKWVWEYKYEYEGEPDPTKAVELSLVNCHVANMSFGCTDGYARRGKQIWIDLCAPVNKLKQCIPLLAIGLNRVLKSIYKYNGLSDRFLEQSKNNGFYEYFTTIRYEMQFPRLQVPIYEENSEEVIDMKRMIWDSRPVHTSPKFEKDLTDKEIEEAFWRMLLGDREKTYYMPGGAYWNVFGINANNKQRSV